jgi:hypothetical protein
MVAAAEPPLPKTPPGAEAANGRGESQIDPFRTAVRRGPAAGRARDHKAPRRLLFANYASYLDYWRTLLAYALKVDLMLSAELAQAVGVE